MTSEELKAAAIELFGEKGWARELASRLGVDRTTVWRYMQSGVPGPAAAAVNCWLERHRGRNEGDPECSQRSPSLSASSPSPASLCTSSNAPSALDREADV